MQILNPVPLDFWQEVAERCSWATFFHTPAWASIITKTFPLFSLASFGFILESGAKAVIPVVAEKKQRLLKTETKFKSMEPGVYGGIIADRALTQGEVDEVIQCLVNTRNAGGRIVGNPFKAFNFPAQLKKKEMCTHTIDLTAGFDALWKKFSRGQKSNINQAQRKNIRIRRADCRVDVERYCDLYAQTLKRWGTKAIAAYPEQLFLNLFEHHDPSIYFYIAEKEGIAIAGIIVLAWQKKLMYWHGCSREEFFNEYPNNLLHYSVIKWGCEQGYTQYDMGPSMDMEGVTRFKKSFGAEKVNFSSYRWK